MFLIDLTVLKIHNDRLCLFAHVAYMQECYRQSLIVLEFFRSQCKSLLLPIFGKILEKLSNDFLYSHLVSSEVLNRNQSGFRPGDLTVNQLISITHTILDAYDCNPPLDARSVYLDISKAFDRDGVMA